MSTSNTSTLTSSSLPAASFSAHWMRARAHPIEFAPHVQIYDATSASSGTPWVPFTLWPAQRRVLRAMHDKNKLVLLKARQLGMTWLALVYALWLMIFQPGSTILLFSLRAAEAVEMLSRLREMVYRLDSPFKPRKVLRATDTLLHLSNGSRALAFSTKSGRSYTGTLAIVDEADYIPDLSSFLNGVKPTIDAGGKLFLISTSDKTRPLSTFKNLYRAAVRGVGDYSHIFLPWSARPDRDPLWYERTRAEMRAQRGADDDFYAEYPATPDEALAAETLDRRFPLDWIAACTLERAPIDADGEPFGPHRPALVDLIVWSEPEYGAHYLIAADPAEGLPTGDESAAVVWRDQYDSYEQVAELAGHHDPAAFAYQLHVLSLYYNRAPVMPERNNHGHALILALKELGAQVLNGIDDKPGWLANVKGKPLAYDLAARVFREGTALLRSAETASQLVSIQNSDLSAPEGMHDDRATAAVIGLAALTYRPPATPSTAIPNPDPLQSYDEKGKW